MILISHRGNINGKNIKLENSPEYLKIALDKGFNVEIDIWFINNKWFFGHDEPIYEINNLFNFTKNYYKKIWFHCKNYKALFEISKHYNYYNSYVFWHQNDFYTFVLGDKNYIWTYPNIELLSNSICVLPEITNYTTKDINISSGICSDYIEYYK